jgi:hypothetical protein
LSPARRCPLPFTPKGGVRQWDTIEEAPGAPHV